MVTENERKIQMIDKINDEIVKNGFKTLTMDSIAKIMGVSRGKLYQHFSSKDEVVKAVVTRYIRYVESKSIREDPKSSKDVIDEFISIFFQNMILAGSVSEIFIDDLKKIYPSLYHLFNQSMTKRDRSVKNFYELGMQNGVFNQGLNAQLLITQDQTMLSVLVLPKYLYTHHLEPAQAIRDYLKLRVLELLPQKYQDLINDEHVEAQVKHLDEKFKRVFLEN